MQIFFALQIALWAGLDPSSTAFQRAERWRLCSWHWSCSVQSRWVPYDKISNNLKRAVLVSEDDIFFQHSGVRVEDMQKAWQRNQQQNQQKTQAGNKSKAALRGGSTITQQLAKNLFLSSEQNYLRKGQELIITGLLELVLRPSTITLQVQRRLTEIRLLHWLQRYLRPSVLISNSIAAVEVLIIRLAKNLSWKVWIGLH